MPMKPEERDRDCMVLNRWEWLVLLGLLVGESLCSFLGEREKERKINKQMNTQEWEGK